MADSLTLWAKASRSYTFAMSVVPYLLGSILAGANYDFNINFCLLGLIGIILVHASFNLLDDYYDWKSGAVKLYQDPKISINTRKHKAFYLEQGLLSQKEVICGIVFCWTVALFIGIFLAYMVGFHIIQIAAIGALLALCYVLPPVELNSKGLGELTIGFIFGPLIMFGAYSVSGGVLFDSVIVLSSIIIGILIANTAHTHSILDYDADLENNKRTLSICLLNKNKAVYIQLLLYIWALLFLMFGIVYKIYPIETIFAMAVLPLIIELNSLMMNNESEIKIWYGPVTQLPNNEDNFFMIRLCLARNINILFAMIFVLTYCLYK